MPADSTARRALKRLLVPLLHQGAYQWIQAAAKAWDIRRGEWREPELDLLRYAIRPGEAVVDIGANFGLYCYHLSRAVGPRGRVEAFEPIPYTCQTAQRVCRILGLRNVRLHQQGCSDAAGTFTFTLPVQRSGALAAGQVHLAGRNDARQGKDLYAPFERERELACEVVTLDAALPPEARVSFIKSDIEGADLRALRGAAGVIERDHPTVLTEIKTWFLDGFGIRAEAFGEFFFPRGYQLFSFTPGPDRPRLRVAQLSALGSYGSDNYVFVHASRRERFASLLEAGTTWPTRESVHS